MALLAMLEHLEAVCVLQKGSGTICRLGDDKILHLQGFVQAPCAGAGGI